MKQCNVKKACVKGFKNGRQITPLVQWLGHTRLNADQQLLSAAKRSSRRSFDIQVFKGA